MLSSLVDCLKFQLLPWDQSEGECFRWYRNTRWLHLDWIWIVTRHIIVLENVCQQKKREAANKILSDTGSLANGERKKVWNVFLNSQDTGGVYRSIFSYFVCCYPFQKSLRVKFLWLVPVFLTFVQIIVVDENNRILQNTVAADLRVLCGNMWHDWRWRIPQNLENCRNSKRHVFHIIKWNFPLFSTRGLRNFFLNLSSYVWMFSNVTEGKINKVSWLSKQTNCYRTVQEFPDRFFLPIAECPPRKSSSMKMIVFLVTFSSFDNDLNKASVKSSSSSECSCNFSTRESITLFNMKSLIVFAHDSTFLKCEA